MIPCAMSLEQIGHGKCQGKCQKIPIPYSLAHYHKRCLEVRIDCLSGQWQEKGETQKRMVKSSSKVLRRSSFRIYRYYNGLESLSHWRMFSIGETVRQRKRLRSANKPIGASAIFSGDDRSTVIESDSSVLSLTTSF